MNISLWSEGVSLGRFGSEGALGPPWLCVVAGLLLLFLGRQLYTALIGLVGFFVVYGIPQDLLSLTSEIRLLMAVGVGVLAALLAFIVRKVAVALAGALLGAGATLWAISFYGVRWDVLWWIVIAAAAVLGAWVLRVVFETALIVVSSFIGALLIMAAVGLEGLPAHAGVALLIVVGVAFQMRRRRAADRDAKKAAAG
ncbi:MAG: hypothetical protein F4060_04405 [Holophagales bacterium]|nr:hypothetical protein [Holophagales bacterium]MYG29745.1 hypothetical protein [Holophagales bacterium]MYI79159.1 hypothetical protein [Holophagales bacterium]